MTPAPLMHRAGWGLLVKKPGPEVWVVRPLPASLPTHGPGPPLPQGRRVKRRMKQTRVLPTRARACGGAGA